MTTMYPELRDVAADGFWRNNAALVQMLGLCPLLAITTTLVNGLALGIATTAVLATTNTIISSMRHIITPLIRIPVFVLVIAALVTSVDLLTNAYFHDLHQVLGLFIPLIITNCAILAQAETVASRAAVVPSALSGIATGLGFAAVLVLLGSMREIVGKGSLFAGAAMLGAKPLEGLTIHLPFEGMLVAALPPGAFFGLAGLLALRTWWLERSAERHRSVARMVRAPGA
jgi:H+/Na+-translocating ferredoxin:NAD+ oxidoreductase subunit E